MWVRKIALLLYLQVFLACVRCLTHIELKKKHMISVVDTKTKTTYIKLSADSSLLNMGDPSYLVFYPFSKSNYEVRAGEKGNMKLVCSGIDKSGCVLNLKDQKAALTSIRGYRVEFVMECTDKCQGNIGFAIDDNVSAEINSIYNLYLSNVDDLRLLLVGSNARDMYKLRMMLSGYNHDSSKGNQLTAWVNFISSQWPTQTSKDFELRHIHGNELAAVFYHKDKMFCKTKSECTYRMTINTAGIYKLEVASAFGDIIEHLKFDINNVVSFNSV